jgi:hypothetical protein
MIFATPVQRASQLVIVLTYVTYVAGMVGLLAVSLRLGRAFHPWWARIVPRLIIVCFFLT